MTTIIGSIVKSVLGFTVLWFIFIWFTLLNNVEAVQRVTPLSWRFSGPKIISPKTIEKVKNGISGNACADMITSAELRYGIPENLLQAVSKVESGKSNDKGEVVAWPWTINVEGKGYFYPTKQAAIDAVKKYQREGKKSIDVGCMQVNLHHHPNAFANLSAAFDPHHNVEYAARFLKGLRRDQSNWHQAVAHYHSANPEYHVPYRQRVMSQWSKEKKFANKQDAKSQIMGSLESEKDMGRLHRVNDRNAYAASDSKGGAVHKIIRTGTGHRSGAAQRKAMAPRIIRASGANIASTKRVGRIVRVVASGR